MYAKNRSRHTLKFTVAVVVVNVFVFFICLWKLATITYYKQKFKIEKQNNAKIFLELSMAKLICDLIDSRCLKRWWKNTIQWD